MPKDKVWMRMGDTDDYRDFDDPFSAGSELGSYLSETGTKSFNGSDIRWRDLGLEIGGFTGYNYISLFWGDNDAQKPQALSAKDKMQFVDGIRDGGYFFTSALPAKKSSTKRKSSKRSPSTPTSIRGMR